MIADAVMSWSQLGGVLGTIGAVAAGAWAAVERLRRTRAETGADVARDNGERAVYKMMTDRLATIEQEVAQMRVEVAQERSHSRALERHIWRLERLMRQAGLEPPLFEDPVHALPSTK